MARSLDLTAAMVAAGVIILSNISGGGGYAGAATPSSSSADDDNTASYHTDQDVFTYRCNLASTYDPDKDPQFGSCVAGIKALLKDGHTYPPDPQRAREVCDPKAVDIRVHCSDECYSAGGDCCAGCMREIGSLMDEYCVRSYGADFKGERCELSYEKIMI